MPTHSKTFGFKPRNTIFTNQSKFATWLIKAATEHLLEPQKSGYDLPATWQMRACNVHARIFDGRKQLIFENGSDFPCYLVDEIEIRQLIVVATALLAEPVPAN